MISPSAPQRFVCVSAIVLGIFGSAADAVAWDEIHHVDGVRVYSQDRVGSEFEELKATATLRIPARDAYAIVSDPGLYLKLIPNLKEATVIGRPKENCVRMYQRFDAPFPLADRDYIVDLCKEVVQRNGMNVYRLWWTSAVDNKRPPLRGVVRVKTTEGHWEFTQSARRRTKAEYYAFADLGGRVPSSLVNQVSAYELPAVIDNLIAVAKWRNRTRTKSKRGESQRGE